MTISQVALSWVVNRDYITSAIIGVSSVAELEENMKVLSPEFRLTATEVNKKKRFIFNNKLLIKTIN